MDQLTSLQQSLSSGNLSGDISSTIINQLLGWILVPYLVVLALILVLYIMRAVHRRKVDNAVFEIRDMLREMRASSSVPTGDNNEPEMK
jgi:hypothetical protein